MSSMQLVENLLVSGSYGFTPKVADPGQRIVVTTRSHETEAVKNAIAACQPTEVRKVGGAGHKVSDVDADETY